ncbi:hypothetical protein COEREDRAFT_87352 [Coemansia reversa NRRL 1564]|uniref:Uncharacterized protein n=1 Tax=Coemansia reversa (strain ATCC 12441 / NRRL 1564) TaxID=763665 RepID=A0A2G5BAX0_COERN|nr:hypothetical protein COEREDRAFT_87352 [Coemansia reversa NRRL 1564]|eukprot:PIA16153.1 hypothetical protein COEREDRAFT_87352 [Coemansia reversa NRRL 1564]
MTWHVCKIHEEEPKPWWVSSAPPNSKHTTCHCSGHSHCHKKDEATPPKLDQFIDQVKGIPGTHEFTFTRTIEKVKTPLEVYQEKFMEFCKAHGRPPAPWEVPYPHQPQPQPQPHFHGHHCGHHHHH